MRITLILTGEIAFYLLEMLFFGVFCAVEAVFPIKWRFENMFWTLELASSLDDAPWPASKDELIDYANRSGAPEEVIENLQELEDDGEVYESIEDIKKVDGIGDKVIHYFSGKY